MLIAIRTLASILDALEPGAPTTAGFIGCSTADAAKSSSSSSNDIDAGFALAPHALEAETGAEAGAEEPKLAVPAANENADTSVCETSLSSTDARFWLLPSL